MKEKILKFIVANSQATPKQILQEFGISNVMVHRHLVNLVLENKISKVGRSPKVFYIPARRKVGLEKGSDEKNETEEPTLEQKIIDEIENNFAYIRPDGVELVGVEAFKIWCKERKSDLHKMAQLYYKTQKEYRGLVKGDYIDATTKIKNSFKDEKSLDSLHYLYFYSLPVFGRTKIANWLFYGKQLQQKKLIKKVLDLSVPLIEKFIQENKIQAIAFVPPSVPRQTQFMKELENALQIKIPKINIVKVQTPITIQQKSLKNIEDRIENAQKTMYVEGAGFDFKRLLIIDDFTGSGSTLNIIAGKMKMQNIAREVYGLTITGSVNGFEVVKEV